MGRLALNQGVSRDPSRAALADAIAKLAERREARETIAAGFARADNLVTEGWRVVEAAEAEIVKLGAGQRDEIIAWVLRGDEAPNTSKRADAERRKSEAEDRLAAAREARDALQKLLQEHDYSVGHAESDVKNCRSVVMWEALPQLIEAALPIQQQLADLAHAIALVPQLSSIVLDADDPRRALARDGERLLKPVLSQELGLPTRARNVWLAAAENLLSDPDAALPSDASTSLSNAT